MANSKVPQGTKFVPNANTVEYQLFPEEYFSGCDVTVYFGDIFVSDISGIQFELQEKVTPVFGYASRTWDAVARGTRLVQGYFKIPFKEAGYIETVLSHIALANEKSKPAIAYKMAGEKVPDWVADTKQTIEEFMTAKDITWVDKVVKTENTIFKNKYPIVPGDKGDHINEIRRLMVKAAAAGKLGNYNNDVFNKSGDSNEVIQYFAKNGANTDTEIIRYAPTWEKNAYQSGSSGQYNVNSHVLPIQHRLAQMTEGSASSVEYGYLNDSYFGRFTSKCAIEVADAFSKPGDGTPLRAAYEAMKASADANGGVDNWKGLNHVTSVKPAALMIELASVHQTDDDLKRYSADMYRAALYIKAAAGTGVTDAWATIKVKGTLGEADIRKLYELAGEQYDPTTTVKEKTTVPGSPMNAENRFSKYEKEIWGREFSSDDNHRQDTFFYTDREQKTGVNVQEPLKKSGFNIYITYGPMPEGIITNNNEMPSAFSFNTTVKGIKNIQLTSSGQTINADGQPIEEMYTFIAQDID